MSSFLKKGQGEREEFRSGGGRGKEEEETEKKQKARRDYACMKILLILFSQ